MANPHYLSGDSFDDVYKDLLWWLSYEPQHVCSPRGQKIKERLAVTLELKNPRARLLSCKKRNTNYGFAVGEFLWYWQGKQDLSTMLYYNKRMKDYSDDGLTLNSAYGHRLKKVEVSYPGINVESGNQWDICKHTLLQDSDSRRAVMTINWPKDEAKAVFEGSKDVPCTLSLQFFIRNNRLDLHVHMRSNDVMWGLTYDLFSFTLFQECMLLDLQKEEKFKDLKLGRYYHTAGSLHLYEPHFKQAEEIVQEYGTSVDFQDQMKPLCDIESLNKVCTIEEALRTHTMVGEPTEGLEGTALWMVQQLVAHREKRYAEEARKKNG